VVRHRSIAAALASALIACVMLAGTAWPESGATPKDDHCAYASKAKGEIVDAEHCAWSDPGGQVHLKRHHLLALDFDRHGLASVNINGGWHYVRRDGRLAPIMAMDNGAEPFADGLARSPAGGKIGFIDRDLVLVIPARYDGALPFQHGQAEVCIECKLVTEGEHSRYIGGRWGCIDRHGRERKPFTPDRAAGEVCRDDGN
jgi:hypothetical protein